MTNLKEIKNRINSVKSTKKITRAMKMVAAAKVKKAETTVKSSRPFTNELKNMFEKMISSVDRRFNSEKIVINHAIDNYPKILERREVENVGLLVITSNKGLAGAYNANIIRRTIETIKEYKSQNIGIRLFIIGQKGATGLKKKLDTLGITPEQTYFNVIDRPNATNTEIIVEDMATLYVNGEIDVGQ